MADSPATLPCHGKINLFLEVQDKRADGYHNLGTVFQTVACCDTLSAEAWDTLALDCPAGITAEPEQNLVIKAARLLRTHCADRLGAKPPGLRFRLEKHLPSGAGLGGGSSDAAAALRLCNRMWGLGLRDEELIPLAARLGADVAFFLTGGCAFGEGKGEVLRVAPSPYPFHVVIGTPHCHVETAWAYAHLDGDRQKRWARFKALYVNFFEDPEFYHLLHNDFEAPMLRHFAPIQSLAESMREFAPVKAMLSGSGASVFALFRDKGPAEQCLEAIRSDCRFACLTAFTD